ncbi:carboxylesterase/lipase family protein [Chondromyces crocatus]|uniref:Carboxylic ester hydrolase n=1 Tax=Chondromyces crocatus TaxID=52 RepID=A0A0K1E694_CHOCO|nr:carboxylesterase family protein [Chondromyces crocatus]AKT36068.1 carboxylesterase [Chondromyces crocatus]
MSLPRAASRALLLGLLATSSGLLAMGCGESDPEVPEPGEPGPLRIETEQGPVEGTLVDTTRTFLGIPFAAPPVGELRWKAPAPPEARTDTLHASAPGSACPQAGPAGTSGGDTSEDCLTLNVWTPERPASSSLPVLVWLHGGGFTFGSGGEPSYDGQRLSEATGAVVVTANYRLGPLGFLALPALKAEDTAHPSAGAYGIEDQRAALAWVKANIAGFGGDPGAVTLFGESAGGASVCIHMTSPASRGLFQRAIVQSGPCSLVADEATAFQRGEALSEALGCQEASDPLACLRGKSSREVLDALPSDLDFISGGSSWYPVVDGWNLPDFPETLLAARDFEQVPTVVGANANEANLFVVLAGNIEVNDDADFEALVEQLVPGQGAAVLARYPSATYGSSLAAAMAAVGDAAFVCPARRTARAVAAAGVPTYLYHFTYAPPNGLFGDLGAFHSAEIKFVFGNRTQLLPQPLEGEELTLLLTMRGFWGRHARSGAPGTEAGVTWPRYDAGTDEALILDIAPRTEAGLRKAECDYWDGVRIGPR